MRALSNLDEINEFLSSHEPINRGAKYNAAYL